MALKNVVLLIFIAITNTTSINTFSQSFIGLNNTENVITETFNNPAFAVNDDVMQINLAGFGFLAGSNAYLFRRNGKIVRNWVEGQDFFKDNDPGNKAVWMNIDILGPAVSFKVKKKYNFAITTRSRYFLNVDNLNPDVFGLIDGKPKNHPDAYSLNNFSLTSQFFSEINLIYSGYLYHSEEHNLTGGIGVKYLIGAGAAGVGTPDLKFNVYENNMMNNVRGVVNFAFTPYANKWLSEGNPFVALQNGLNNTGLGLDLGLRYEYTPLEGMVGKNSGYLFWIAISITDIGSINYTASSTTGTYIANADTIDLNKLNKSANTTYGDYIYQYKNDSVFKINNAKNKFKVGLPTALHINGDFKLLDILYFNANILLNLRKPSTENFGSHYISTLAFTPRLQWKYFGVGMPFSYNAYKDANIGIVLYAGPFYIGSSTLISSFAQSNIYNIDAYAGLSFRIKSKNHDLYGRGEYYE